MLSAVRKVNRKRCTNRADLPVRLTPLYRKGGGSFQRTKKRKKAPLATLNKWLAVLFLLWRRRSAYNRVFIFDIYRHVETSKSNLRASSGVIHGFGRLLGVRAKKKTRLEKTKIKKLTSIPTCLYGVIFS